MTVRAWLDMTTADFDLNSDSTYQFTIEIKIEIKIERKDEKMLALLK
jgi:hypothetical protein